MNLELSIDPKQINEYMAQKILESALGEAMKKAVESEVAKWSFQSYGGGAATQVVNQFAAKIANELLENEFADVLRAKFRAAITEVKLDEIVKSAVSKLEINDRY